MTGRRSGSARAARLSTALAIVLTCSLAAPSPGFGDIAGQTFDATVDPAGPSVPFYAIDRTHIPVPDGVMPWGPVWTSDGEHIVFQDYHFGGEWLADADGTQARCLTCSMQDRPDISPGFVYPFPDAKRLFVANELGSKAYVLECSPSIVQCDHHSYLAVDFSADAAYGRVMIDRRTYHLAPDGQHLGYTLVRTDGLLMVVGRLERQTSTYALTRPKVVNPRGPSGPLDTRADAWARGASLYELKSFVDGGRSILAFSEHTGVPQQVKIDLATGRMSPLATYPDWNEDGATSPDGSLLLTGSWRTQNRMTPLAVLPSPMRPSPLVPVFPAVGLYYISSRPGFACDLQPWLLPPSGDQDGSLVGQPLNPYLGGTEIGANNLSGQQVWSPDSTRVLLQGRSLEPMPADAGDYLAQKGPAPSELIIARIARPPAEPAPAVSSDVGAWAPSPADYRSSYDYPGVHLLRGSASGTVVYTNGGDVAGGTFEAVYRNFSEDGEYFVTGVVTRAGTAVAADDIDASLTVVDRSGTVVGSMKIDLLFTHTLSVPQPGEPTTEMHGSVTAQWQGRTYRGLTPIGPCTDTLPRPSDLGVRSTVARTRGTTAVSVVVTADIHGDVRPVQGAVVTVAGQRATTDAQGRAEVMLTGGVPATAELVVTAGDTFVPAQKTIDLR